MTNRFSPGIFASLIFLLLFAPATYADDAIQAAEFDLSNYQGKVVVLDFWASWCVPCRRSFPWLNSMQEKFSDDGLVVIGVNVDAEPADAQNFLQEVPARFQLVSDHAGDLARRYEVIAMPSSYVFDREGKLITKHLGFKVKQESEYEEILVRALASGQ